MKTTITKNLQKKETDLDMEVLFAIESGSRVRGFESPDSDYDVRFVYKHKPSHYLTIKPKPDVIESMEMDGLLDFAGWDIKKTLILFQKSNPSLLEWLNSDIVYTEQTNFKQELLTLSKKYYSPKTNFHHYLNMASKTFQTHLQGEMVKLKKYLYTLRPLFACEWILRYQTLAPLDFDKLSGEMLDDDKIKVILDDLLERKKASKEKHLEPTIPELNQFIIKKLERLSDKSEGLAVVKISDDVLDEILRRYVK